MNSTTGPMQPGSPGDGLAPPDRAVLEERVRSLFAPRKDGDCHCVTAWLSPDITHVAGADRRQGLGAIEAHFRAFDAEFETLASVLHDILIEGERAVVRRTDTLRHRRTLAVGDVGVINFLRFREGMLVEFSEFPDTATMARLAEKPESP